MSVLNVVNPLKYSHLTIGNNVKPVHVNESNHCQLYCQTTRLKQDKQLCLILSLFEFNSTSAELTECIHTMHE